MLHYIGEFSRPGAVNDISYDGPYNEGIRRIDHLAYRLGVRQASSLKAIQYGAVLLVGSWLAVELVTRRVSWGLGVSLVSLYSVVFLYHRVYDAVMIVPALVYAIGRAKATSGRAHWLYVVATVLMLLLLYQRHRLSLRSPTGSSNIAASPRDWSSISSCPTRRGRSCWR